MGADGDAVLTASAYVVWEGRFVFMFGMPAGADDRLGVVRLGGHREGDEGPWACAAREVMEESGLRVRALAPPATYWIESGQDEEAMGTAPWAGNSPEEPTPLLVGWRWRRDGRAGRDVSPTYLARAEGAPQPGAEAQGLLLLRPEEVKRLARERLTLATFLDGGGSALCRVTLPMHLPLVPLMQLRALAVLLDRYPSLADG